VDGECSIADRRALWHEMKNYINKRPFATPYVS
jgi:hypothetical protein